MHVLVSSSFPCWQWYAARRTKKEHVSVAGQEEGEGRTARLQGAGERREARGKRQETGGQRSLVRPAIAGAASEDHAQATGKTVPLNNPAAAANSAGISTNQTQSRRAAMADDTPPVSANGPNLIWILLMFVPSVPR